MSLRLGVSHKSGIERSLVTIRAHVQTALDTLEQDGVVRAELEEAAKALRGLELRLSTERRRPAAASALLEDDKSTSPETRAFLLRNFTEHDEETAETNVEIQSSSSSPSKEARMLRRSSIQVAEDVRDVLALPEISRILKKVGQIEFDALALFEMTHSDHRCISVFGACVVSGPDQLFKQLQAKEWIGDTDNFMHAWLAFCNRMDFLYKPDVVYHSSGHAVDVAATTHWLMQSDYMTRRTTKLDHFLAIAAAVMHDVGHPGKNNLWHQKTMSPFALRYNDKAILENMHVALAFETMQADSECDWFSMLQRSSEGADLHHSANLRPYARRALISMVLATDMAKHTLHCQQLKALAEAHGEALDLDMRPAVEKDKQEALADKLFLLETVVHAADISNPCKPRDIMLSWSRRVLSEFWLQGDEERRLGLEVSPLCDRESGLQSVPKGQVGFINFVVFPFFFPLADLLVEASEALGELKKNREFWQAQDLAGSTFEQLFGGPPLPPLSPLPPLPSPPAPRQLG